MKPAVAYLCALLILLLTACSGSDDAPTSTRTPAPTPTGGAPSPAATPGFAMLPPAEPIDWQACPRGPFECAEYDVPLDYGDPGGASIRLAVRRLPAGDREARIGLLFANPGGPGGSTIDTLSGWARTLPLVLRERFDIILFDPRGVGHSSPLVCHDNIQDVLGLDPFPESDEDWQETEETVREFTEACGEAGAGMLPFLGTTDVARDMDRLREASGESTLSYFGYSYGTTLGQVYASLFPGRVRAMVLDGAVDIALSGEQLALEQTLAFEAAFQRYVDQCAARACLPGDPRAVIESLLAEADARPIPAEDGDRNVGPGEALYGIVQGMYSPALWPLLTAALQGALEGDASGLLYLADSYAGRRPDGSYANSMEANSAVNCLDYETERDPAYHRRIGAQFGEVAPMFGPAIGQLGLFCAFWPVEPRPIEPTRAPGTLPIMVIGGTGDAATPYVWAQRVTERLTNAFLVTLDGEGHGAYRIAGSTCVDEAVAAYLLELTVPEPGLRCGSAGIEPVPLAP